MGIHDHIHPNITHLCTIVDDDYEIWPKTRNNTILNICPKGEYVIVERLGNTTCTYDYI
jgi:hypothetical protein